MAIPGNLTGWPSSITWFPFLKVPKSLDPDGHAANTVAPFSASFKTRHGKGGWNIIAASVTVSVHQTESWVVTNAQTDTLLRHEQGHFDISGIAGRDLLRGLRKVAESPFDSESKMNAAVGELRKTLQGLVDFLNKLYDKETKHGADADAQLHWQTKISFAAADRGQLADLSPWGF